MKLFGTTYIYTEIVGQCQSIGSVSYLVS